MELTQAEESKVIALLVRGDKPKAIITTMLEDGVKLNPWKLAAIKKANLDLVGKLQTKVIERRTSSALNILNKSRSLIEQHLDRVQQSEDKRQLIWDQFISGEINGSEYIVETQGLPAISIAELNSVSRESFSQSQIEQGKPTSISANPQDAKLQLDNLVKALQSGDEVELTKMVFNPRG